MEFFKQVYNNLNQNDLDDILDILEEKHYLYIPDRYKYDCSDIEFVNKQIFYDDNTILHICIERNEFDSVVELIKIGADVTIRNKHTLNAFDTLCKYTENSMDKNTFTFLMNVMNKTSEECLTGTIKFHNYFLFTLFFEKYNPDQQIINELFSLICTEPLINKTIYVPLSYSQKEVDINIKTKEDENDKNIINFLAKYVTDIDDKSLNYIMKRSIYVAIGLIFNKPTFNVEQITKEHLIQGIKSCDITLCNLICDANKKLIDGNIISNIITHWKLNNIKQFLEDHQINLIDYAYEFRKLIETAINSESAETLKFILETFNVKLDNYNHSKQITKPTIIQLLMKYGYKPVTDKEIDFAFDSNQNIESLYNMIEGTNNTNLILAILFQKISKLEELLAQKA